MYLWNWEGKTERNAVSALVGSSCDQSTCSDSDCCLRVVYFGIFFTCILWGSAESGWRRDCIPFCAFYRYGVSLPACPLSCSLTHKNPGLQIMSVAQSCPCQETTELSLWAINLLWRRVVRITTFGTYCYSLSPSLLTSLPNEPGGASLLTMNSSQDQTSEKASALTDNTHRIMQKQKKTNGENLDWIRSKR